MINTRDKRFRRRVVDAGFYEMKVRGMIQGRVATVYLECGHKERRPESKERQQTYFCYDCYFDAQRKEK
jgi:hypothetical protein